MLRRCMARMAEQLAREPSHAAPTKRLTKLGPDDDVEAYLEIFERTAARERWPADQWGYILAPFLSGDAQRAYRDLSTAQAAHYPTLKRAILAHYGHSLPAQAQRFHDWVYDPLGSVRSQVSQLVRLAERWLVEGEGPPHLDRLVIDRCIRALPTGAKRWASGNQPRTVNDLVELLENHQVTQRLCGGATPAGGGAGETRTERRGRTPESQRTQAPPTRAPAYPNQTIADRRGPAPPTQREEWRCYTCGQTGHLARHCPGAGDVSMPTASPSDRRGGVCLRTTCWSHERTDTPSLPVRVGRHDTHALLDSGSVVTLVRPDLADGVPGRRIDVGCIHGQTESYSTRQITVRTPKGTFTVRAGLVPNLPMPLLIGRDCPIFAQLLGAELQAPRRRPPRTRPRRLRSRPAYMASHPTPSRSDSNESPDRAPREAARHAPASSTVSLPPGTPDTLTGSEQAPPPDEEESPPLIDFTDYPLADGGGPGKGGQFATAQLEDDALRHAWGHVQVHEGLSRDSVSDRRYPHFSTRGGLLYRVVQRGGKEVEQLVVPRPYVSKVLYMAHTHLLGAHLGVDKTRDRILDRFFWPGVKRNVEDYCRACPECQHTAPRPTVRNPLIPMPLIEVPFDRLGLDIVGPLPKTSRGHRYVLVMVDYATRYPEAVPLRAATAKAVARELMVLFSRVGIVREILTDQGSCFMSRVLKGLTSLLQIRHLRTSVYHPQTDGLVERFNKTLKSMLKKVMEADGKNWDQLLPHVLFAVREVPQASTGFSPFELLYGRRPRGLLDIARDAWESQPSPHRTVVEHVEQMRGRMAQIWPVVREHLGRAQQAQARVYNRGAKLRTFNPGDQVLVLVPTAECKFLAKWQGPYDVIDRVGEVNYRVRQPGRRKTIQVYHINLLKQWHPPTALRDPALLSLSAQLPLPEVPVGDQLSPSQSQDLKEVVLQHLDVFSERPGRTATVSHDIKTEPGVRVRLRPYRIPEARRAAIRAEVTSMLQMGIIEESHSAWSSPVVLVPKPDGSYRFCNDFRKLNEVSAFDAYPMPRIDELIERLGPARFITTLDLTKGYWQVPLTQRAREKTAFATPDGLYQYTVLPFGVHGAPATFQRMMDRVLRAHREYAAAYIDDIVIHSSTWDLHLHHLRAVLGALRAAGLTANPKKCHLGLEEASYLGYRVGRGSVKPQEEKVQTIQTWPRPRTKKQVKSFLGLVGYYQRFIPAFATLASPLHELTRRALPDRVEWTEEVDEAFLSLRRALCTEPLLITPDFNLPFVVHTDASEVGLGAVLSQVRSGEEHPVTYISRKLLTSEKAYSTVEKEALAIKWTLEKLRYYLLGRTFTLVTDHAPLKWMATAKDTNARVTRWFLALQDYHFQVVHRPGRAHANADALSRRDACLGLCRADPDLQLRGGVCGNPDPTEEFEPRQRPLRGQVVRGRYVPLGAAMREGASSAPAQSRRCGAPGGARQRRGLNGRVDTSQGNATERERRSGWRLPEPPLMPIRFPPGLSRRRRRGSRPRPPQQDQTRRGVLYSQTRKNLSSLLCSFFCMSG